MTCSKMLHSLTYSLLTSSEYSSGWLKMQLKCINIHLAEKGPLVIKCTTFIQILAELDLQGGWPLLQVLVDAFTNSWWVGKFVAQFCVIKVIIGHCLFTYNSLKHQQNLVGLTYWIIVVALAVCYNTCHTK